VSSEKDDAWRRRGGLGEARLGKPSSPVQKFIRIRYIQTEIWPRGAPTSGDALTAAISTLSTTCETVSTPFSSPFRPTSVYIERGME
jgi:hypothetical protein